MGNLLDEKLSESLSGKFLKFVNNKLGPAKLLKVEYTEANNPKFGDENGKYYVLTFDGGKIYTTKSKRLMRSLGDINAGDTVVITRIGDRFETQYKAEKVKDEIPF